MFFLQRNDNNEKYYCIFIENYTLDVMEETIDYLRNHNMDCYVCYVYINNKVSPVIKLICDDIKAMVCFSLLKSRYYVKWKV